MLQERETWVAVPSGELYVKQWQFANSVAAPIILLHDSLGSVAQWRGFPANLARATGRSVVAYDRLGFGQSTLQTLLPTPSFIADEAKLYLPAIAAALGLQAYVLLGHSVGGGMAFTNAAHQQEQCLAVISVAAQAFVEERTLLGIRAAEKALSGSEQFSRLARWHGERAQWVLDAWTKVWLAPAFRDWSLDAVLPNVRCPVLAIHGGEDEFGSQAFPKRIIKTVRGPAELVLLPLLGHVPHREDEEAVLHAVQAFLAKHLAH